MPFTDCEIRQNGKTIFRYGQGFSDYEHSRPVSATDLYWMYSCSKVVTAVAAMRLIEQERLGLYDLVESYIPEFSDVTVLQRKDTRFYDPLKAEFVGAAGSLLLIDPNNRISCVYTQHVRKCSLATNYIHRHIIRAIYTAE